MLEDKLYHLDNPENTGNDIQVDDFPKTTEFLNQKGMEEKQDIIKQVLTDINLKQGFEKFLNESSQVLKIKCKKNLQNCQSLDAVKSIIAEVVGYKIGEVEMSGSLNILEHKKEEKVKAGKEEVKAGKEEVKAKEEKVKAEKEKVKAEINENNNGIIENMKNAIKERDILLDKYVGLKEKTDKDSDLYNAVESNLKKSGKFAQLEEIGKSINDSSFVENYILLQTTLTELKSNPTIYDQNDISYFDKIVKNLDNDCNIPDTNLNSFSSKNITRTRHELFNSDIGNQDLIDSKKSNLKSRDYTDLFPGKSEKELINEYGKFLDNEQIKSLIVKYNNNENLTDEEKNYLITGCRSAKEQIDNKTKDMVEELCLISQIKGMYMCMGEGADFQMNKANEIESKDGILTLNGHIDGIAFSIRQDTNDPEARLQTSTRLRKKDNAFEIGNHFEDSNFILPSQSEVFDLAVKSVNSDGALQEAETPADYVSKLQDKIMSKMDDMYEDTKYANHYMHEQVKGEQIMDKSLALVKNLKKSEIPTPITESNKGLFDFIGLIYFNIKNSTSLEKDRMDSCLEKIQNLVNEYKDKDKQPESGKYPPIIEHYLTDKAILKNTKTLLEGGVVVEGESMFDLFGKYRDKSDQRSDGKFGMIDFVSLKKDLVPNEDDRSQISQQYDARNESDNADVVLMDSRNEAEKNSIVGINEVYSLA